MMGKRPPSQKVASEKRIGETMKTEQVQRENDMTTETKIHHGMIDTPALPKLREIAKECDGQVEELRDFTNVWPNRNTDPGDRHQSGRILVAQGWDGDKLYGVTCD